MSKKSKQSWYDSAFDILYIQVHKGSLADSREISEDIRFDLDEKGEVLGIEIRRARTRVLEPISSEIAVLLEKNIQSV